MLEINDTSFIIETEKFIKALKIKEILFFKADGCYTEINLMNKEKILIAKPLKEIQTYFQNKHFFRCHKSYLINMDYFRELHKNNKERIIIMINDVLIPVSQRKILLFKEFLKNYMITFN